jgi:hypothetical protein
MNALTFPSAPSTRAGVDLEQPHDAADRFVNALAAGNPLWDGDASRWIFRGQANAGRCRVEAGSVNVAVPFSDSLDTGPCTLMTGMHVPART